MSEFHEPPEELSPETRDFRRALNSLMEEIQAIDWYQQRVDATGDEQLKKVIEHNKQEEIEHALMALEWLRRNMNGWDEKMKQYLFKEGDIAALEEKEDDSESQKDLGIGKIK
jgi:uncharacterized protein